MGVFLPLLSTPQRAWGSPFNSGCQRPQLLSLAPEVQDAEGPQCMSGHHCRELVCHHRSEGRLLSGLNLAGAVALPQILVQWAGLRRLPLWHLCGPPDLPEMQDAAFTPMSLRGLRILNYLDDWLVCASSVEQCCSYVASKQCIYIVLSDQPPAEHKVLYT